MEEDIRLINVGCNSSLGMLEFNFMIRGKIATILAEDYFDPSLFKEYIREKIKQLPNPLSEITWSENEFKKWMKIKDEHDTDLTENIFTE